MRFETLAAGETRQIDGPLFGVKVLSIDPSNGGAIAVDRVWLPTSVLVSLRKEIDRLNLAGPIIVAVADDEQDDLTNASASAAPPVAGASVKVTETTLLNLMQGTVVQASGAWPANASYLDVVPTAGVKAADLVAISTQVAAGAATVSTTPTFYGAGGDQLIVPVAWSNTGSAGRGYIAVGGQSGGGLSGMAQAGYLTHRWDLFSKVRIVISFGGVSFPYTFQAINGAGTSAFKLLLREYLLP